MRSGAPARMTFQKWGNDLNIEPFLADWLTNLSFHSRAAPERPSRYPRKREKSAEKRALSLTHPGAEPIELSSPFPRSLKFVSQPAFLEKMRGFSRLFMT